jgi:hypothetical protein
MQKKRLMLHRETLRALTEESLTEAAGVATSIQFCHTQFSCNQASCHTCGTPCSAKCTTPC